MYAKAEEHPLREIMRKAGINDPGEATVIIEKLQKTGYDNVVACKSLSSPKLLERFVFDASHRDKLAEVLQKEIPFVPSEDEPLPCYLRQLLVIDKTLAQVRQRRSTCSALTRAVVVRHNYHL